jgi:transcriptional regulator with GAF, ATPase, and Fis domain
MIESGNSRNIPFESSNQIAEAPLESIVCTQELRNRPSRSPEFEKENRAFVALASALADSPHTILQTLAETILEVTQSDSSGVSLLMTDGKRFYWPAIAGRWKPHIGGGTPRDFGPCGEVLDRNTPLLMRHLERRYNYFLPVTPLVEECLLVPFYFGGKAVGTIWAVMHDDRHGFDAEDERLMNALAKFASSAYQAVASIDELKFQIAEREKAETALQELTDGLEIQVRVRTEELEQRNKEVTQLQEQLFKENIVLREEIDKASMFEEIVGSSEALRKILAQVSRVAPSDSTVLLLGETGTGKELIARAIHNRSKRAGHAFIRVNCAAIPPSLIASELFGHEKGSFTGAIQQRMGRFEAADGGTIFLDEIGDLPAETQIALLRVLQEREIERVGSIKPISVDVRVLAATNRHLEDAIADGTFRTDLFYRLNIFPMQIPSLRDRVDDIPLLVEYFVERYAKKVGKKFKNISKKTYDLFQSYGWPGNIRELQNVVERAVILCDGDTFSVDATWFKRDNRQPSGPTVALATALEERERGAIETALADAHGQVGGPKGAAAKLSIPRQTLESKIKLLGINKFRFKTP